MTKLYSYRQTLAKRRWLKYYVEKKLIYRLLFLLRKSITVLYQNLSLEKIGLLSRLIVDDYHKIQLEVILNLFLLLIKSVDVRK